MAELVYITDFDGILQSINADAWNEFARENDGGELLDHGSLIGRPLLDFIAGGPTKTATSTLLGQLRSGTRRTVSYLFACDGPNDLRSMRMTITPLPAKEGFEFRSELLESRSRLVELVLGNANINRERIDLPIVTICSVCKRLQDPRDENNWLDVEVYERGGGDTNVRISHGLCGPCMLSMLSAANA